MKFWRRILVVSYFISWPLWAAVNAQFSLEVKIDPSVVAKISGLVHERLRSNHGFAPDQLNALIQDLSALASVKGGESSPLFYEIFLYQKQWDGPWLAQWLLKGIREFRTSKGEPCSTMIEKNYNACAIINTQTIVLSPAHFQNDRIKRILTLVHERRHFDGYLHIPNTPSWDNEIKGSRGAQLALIVSMVNSCSNCTIIAKQQIVGFKDEVLGAIKNLSQQDQEILNTELASLRSPMKKDVALFLAELKRHPSFISVNHFECKNRVPLYMYDQMKKTIPNVDAQDCFYIYYKSKTSPNLGEEFPEGAIDRLGVRITFAPVNL